MDTRVAVIAIIIENIEAVETVNQLLCENREYIIGRMGIPYKNKGISIISIAIDAPQDMIWERRHRQIHHCLQCGSCSK